MRCPLRTRRVGRKWGDRASNTGRRLQKSRHRFSIRSTSYGRVAVEQGDARWNKSLLHLQRAGTPASEFHMCYLSHLCLLSVSALRLSLVRCYLPSSTLLPTELWDLHILSSRSVAGQEGRPVLVSVDWICFPCWMYFRITGRDFLKLHIDAQGLDSGDLMMGYVFLKSPSDPAAIKSKNNFLNVEILSFVLEYKHLSQWLS